MKQKRNIVYLAGFVFSISLALTSYINSSFLQSYISEYYVGIVYIVASIVTILGMFELPNMLSRIGNRQTTLLFSLMTLLSFVLMSYGGKAYIAIPAFILCFVASNFIIATLDIFIEGFSKDSTIGKFRGLYLVIINSAWVLAQMISGSVIEKSSFRGIYLLSALFMFIVCIILFFRLRDYKDPEYVKHKIIQTFKTFFKNKNLSRIYAINLILKFFFAWMVIYTPIYLHDYIGFAWDQIGVIFTIMLLPFVLFSFPLGNLSDKIGEKKMLLWGFLISAVPTMLIPIVSEPKVWLWAIVLFSTRIGASIIETMSETYFFKSVNEKQDDEIALFRSTTPISFIIAPLVAVPVLFFVPSFKYLFFVLGAILLLGFFITIRLRDVK